MKVLFEFIIIIYVTLMPTILGPMLSMVLLKTRFLKGLHKVIDFGRNAWDGNRIFGDNKTWRGFWIYVVATAIVSVLWGEMCRYIPAIGSYNTLYTYHENTFFYNLLIGMIFGASYPLFELPNSFLKRRLGINSGNTQKANGWKGNIFRIVDLVDSGIGCLLVWYIIYPIKLWQCVFMIVLSAVTHYGCIWLLCRVKIKKSM